MNRWLMVGAVASLMMVSTGCLHHNTRSGCSDCGSMMSQAPTCGCESSGCGCQASSDCGCGDACSDCESGSCKASGCGLLGKSRGRMAGCHSGCGRTGCSPSTLRWQQGGMDYSDHLSGGVCGQRAATVLQNQPVTPGPPTAQVAYPYYSFRGPRDFLLANPPSIGP